MIGAEAAKLHGGTAVIDSRLFPESIRELDGLAELEEKEPLIPDRVSFEDVARRIGEFSPFPESLRARTLPGSPKEEPPPAPPPTPAEKFQAIIAEFGWFRLPILICGSLLRKSGELFIRCSRRRTE